MASSNNRFSSLCGNKRNHVDLTVDDDDDDIFEQQRKKRRPALESPAGLPRAHDITVDYNSDQEPPATEAAEEYLRWRHDDEDDDLSDWTIQVVTTSSPADGPTTGAAAGEGKVGRAGPVDDGVVSSSVKSYHVHKYVLATGPRRSEYFCGLFQAGGRFAESASCTSRIELDELAAPYFPELLDFLYAPPDVADEVIQSKFTTQNATALYSLAKYFHIRRLRWLAKQFWTKDAQSRDTCGIYYEHAKRLQEESVLQAACLAVGKYILDIPTSTSSTTENVGGGTGGNVLRTSSTSGTTANANAAVAAAAADLFAEEDDNADANDNVKKRVYLLDAEFWHYYLATVTMTPEVSLQISKLLVEFFQQAGPDDVANTLDLFQEFTNTKYLPEIHVEAALSLMDIERQLMKRRQEEEEETDKFLADTFLAADDDETSDHDDDDDDDEDESPSGGAGGTVVGCEKDQGDAKMPAVEQQETNDGTSSSTESGGEQVEQQEEEDSKMPAVEQQETQQQEEEGSTASQEELSCLQARCIQALAKKWDEISLDQEPYKSLLHKQSPAILAKICSASLMTAKTDKNEISQERDRLVAHVQSKQQEIDALQRRAAGARGASLLERREMRRMEREHRIAREERRRRYAPRAAAGGGAAGAAAAGGDDVVVIANPPPIEQIRQRAADLRERVERRRRIAAAAAAAAAGGDGPRAAPPNRGQEAPAVVAPPPPPPPPRMVRIEERFARRRRERAASAAAGPDPVRQDRAAEGRRREDAAAPVAAGPDLAAADQEIVRIEERFAQRRRERAAVAAAAAGWPDPVREDRAADGRRRQAAAAAAPPPPPPPVAAAPALAAAGQELGEAVAELRRQVAAAANAAEVQVRIAERLHQRAGAAIAIAAAEPAEPAAEEPAAAEPVAAEPVAAEPAAVEPPQIEVRRSGRRRRSAADAAPADDED